MRKIDEKTKISELNKGRQEGEREREGERSIKKTWLLS